MNCDKRIAEECGYWPSRVRRALRAERVDDPVDREMMREAA